MTSKIFSSWLRVELPWKSTRPSSISAKTQPSDQMSLLYEYLSLPSRISGARYQREAT